MIYAVGMTILYRALTIVAFGAVLVSVSEFLFYRVEDEVDSFLILLAYGLLGYLFLAMVHRFRVTTFAGFVVAASLLGFLIEGVPVPVVYSAPPMTVVWTSLAWHGLITLGVAWAFFRPALASRLPIATAYNVALGAFLGAWNAYMWNAREATAGEANFEWQPIAPFVEQFLFGYTLFVTGHMAMDRLYPKFGQISKAEHLILWLFAIIISAIVAFGSGLLVTYPVFLILVCLCLWALSREHASSKAQSTLVVDRIMAQPIALHRYMVTIFMPMTAIAVYWLIVEQQLALEMNVLVILTAGPFSVFLFVWSLIALVFNLHGPGSKRIMAYLSQRQ